MNKQKINTKICGSIVMLFLAVLPYFAQDDLSADERRRASPTVQMRLKNTRRLVRERKWSFKVGLTSVSERELSGLTGDIIPPNIKQIAVQQNSLAAGILKISPQQILTVDLLSLGMLKPQLEIDKFGKVTDKSKDKTYGLGKSESEKRAEASKDSLPSCVAASGASFDWRQRLGYLPVRQQMCGNCWAYAVQAVYELVSIRNKNYNPFDTSEQFLVSNSGAGNCKGGNRAAANKFLNSFGAMKEESFPDLGTNGMPSPNASAVYQPILTWGFVDPNNEQPSVQAIKQALCTYGPVTASINATNTLLDYTDGVFDEGANEDTNHAIVIIGWDDAKGAWLIRNSWGTGWGNNGGFGTEGGYGWVKYGANRVGRWAQWIVVK